MLYQDQPLPVRPLVAERHAEAIADYGRPGTWLTAAERVKVLAEARSAPRCALCCRRRDALSPYSEPDGEHDHATDLPANTVDVIHRVVTDSGRLTHRWFLAATAGDLARETYVEIVGLVATSIILDSFAHGLGIDPLPAPAPEPGAPSRHRNPQVTDGGAWVPLLDVVQNPTEVILPTAPNIFRAMGLVMGAITHFFGVMRAHYSLTEQDAAISRAQIELIAARVSSHNQCFY